MAYATVDDMVARFGPQEMIRLSTPAGQDLDGIVTEAVLQRLEDASSFADSYLRLRYQTPIEVAPQEVVRVVCDIARFDLSTGDGKTSSDEIRARNAAAIAWCRDVAAGKVRLALDQVDEGLESYARETARPAAFDGTFP